jgi:hypothetical protein
MADDPIAIVEKFVADYEDAPNWGGPTMYPSVPIGAISAVLSMARKAKKNPKPEHPVKLILDGLELAWKDDKKQRRPNTEPGWRTVPDIAILAGLPGKISFVRRVLYRATEEGIVDYCCGDPGFPSHWRHKKGGTNA